MHWTGGACFSRWKILISPIIFLLSILMYIHILQLTSAFPWMCPWALWTYTCWWFVNLQASIWSACSVVSQQDLAARGPCIHPSPFGHKLGLASWFPLAALVTPAGDVLGWGRELMEDVPWTCCSQRQVIFQAYRVFCALFEIYEPLIHIICQCLIKLLGTGLFC